MNQSGNRTNENTLLSVMLKLKENIMVSTHVAGLVKVNHINSNDYSCELFDGSAQQINCCALKDLTLAVGDICLVLFCDKDFRATLSSYIASDKIIEQNSIETHSLNYGVIVGIIFRRELEE